MKFNASLLQKIGAKAGSYVRKKAEANFPPTLGSANRVPYGAFQFKTQIARGAEYDIHASTDLKNWTSISRDASKGVAIDYVDSEAGKFSHRFYRIIAGGVHSTNVIGYAAVTLPPGFSMIANPLESDANTVAELFKNWPDGTTLNKFDTRFFQLTENEIKNGKWMKPGETLSPGEGAIFYNPTHDYKSHNFVGEVMQGNLSIPIPSGFSVRSSSVPQPGRLHTDLHFPIAEGDVIHLFDRDRQKYVLYPYEAAAWAANPPVISLGESFWVAKTSPGNWTTNFTIGV